MNRLLKTPVLLHKGRYKDKNYFTQYNRVFTALYKQPKTMLMVSIETGILRANICRYIAKMQEKESVVVVRKGICAVSKHRAGFYTTNFVEHSNIDSYGIETSI